ncbi:hypothetical protein [Enhydrobacter aerosaccus]|uniref:hypothetical protein n=1 Tax=Enhydrobacter aerosaccus TaxID=225324 RepID=UPI001C465A5D
MRQLAHTVSVMHRGRIVEHGIVTGIFDNPQHPHTAALLKAIPSGIAAIAGGPHLGVRPIVDEAQTA